jgi:phosphoenolpyruvate carboxykinase (ATP)
MLKKGDAQLFTHYALQLKDTSVPIADPESDCCPQLKQKGFLLDGTVILHNAPPALLYEEAMKHEEGTYIVSTGALATRSGAKTGRSPGDKRIVDEDSVRENVWWGSVNIKLSQRSFNMNRARALDYLNTRKQLFVVDGYAGWDERHRQKIRVVSTRAYHALFMYNMLIRPNMEELAHFGDPDYYIYNAGEFVANQLTEGNTSPCSITISFEKREMVLLGTQYAGEMKKGVFTIMHYLMPKAGVLSLHASANEGEAGDVSLFFGLSGTGKTTLSADTRRKLIGDDEHCWSENGVFNIEGGCYAKTASLSAKAEPEIWAAIRFGTVLENIVFDSDTREVDYEDISITENTRAAYPIDYISSAKIPCVGGHPRNIVFLTCDAFGVLPPVSRLTVPQALYHFLSGYTAKIAGTESGVTEPQATFSSCFGQPFLVWHPSKYAAMLKEKIEAHGTLCWLVNTGWTGGMYGVGHRMKIAHSRAIIDAIHSGELARVPYANFEVFNLSIPTECPGVDPQVLHPAMCWKDKGAFADTLRRLAGMFNKNFAQFEKFVEQAVRDCAPLP